MYVVNQVADFFPSDGDNSGNYYGDKNYYNTYTKNGKTDLYPILDQIFAGLDNPPVNINKSNQANLLIPLAIRATASLLYLFAQNTNQNIQNIPLTSVDIYGPFSITHAQQVTLTAIPTNGIPPLHYKWEHRWVNTGGEGPISPLSIFSIGSVKPMTAIGSWNIVGTDSDELIFQVGGDSEFRVTATDLTGATVISYHTVDVPGGGVLDPNINENSELNLLKESNIKSISLNNHPNPFNPSTTIRFGLPEAQNVSIEIYNSLGERVRTLLNETKGAGYHDVVWNGKDASGRQVSSGIYIYVLKTKSKRITKKMFLIK